MKTQKRINKKFKSKKNKVKILKFKKTKKNKRGKWNCCNFTIKNILYSIWWSRAKSF